MQTHVDNRPNQSPHEELIRLIDLPRLPGLPLRPGAQSFPLPTVRNWVYRGVRGHRLRTQFVGA